MAISLTECEYKMLPLAPLNEPYPKSKPCKAVPIRNNNMYNEVSMSVTERTDADKQREYLNERAYSLNWKKEQELQKKFAIIAPDGPKTAAETAQRLKDGAYTIDMTNPDREIYSWRDVFNWRTKPADYAGYNVAKKDLDKQYQDLQDAIAVKSPETALTALQAFETWTG